MRYNLDGAFFSSLPDAISSQKINNSSNLPLIFGV